MWTPGQCRLRLAHERTGRDADVGAPERVLDCSAGLRRLRTGSGGCLRGGVMDELIRRLAAGVESGAIPGEVIRIHDDVYYWRDGGYDDLTAVVMLR